MSYPKTRGGPPLRALAMVLIAVAIVFAGLGAMSLSGGDSEDEETEQQAAPETTSSAPTSTALVKPASTTTSAPQPTTTSAAATTTTTQAPAGAIDHSLSVRVLNNSTVSGLASRTAGQLRAQGWTNTSPGNYAASTVATTTVYYGDSPGDRAAAQAIADELGVGIAPRFPELGESAGVVVVLTGD